MTDTPPTAAPVAETTEKTIDWNAMLAPYRQPVAWKSGFQLASTAFLLALFWGLAAWSLQVGYWLTLILAIPASMMIARLFMLPGVDHCGLQPGPGAKSVDFDLLPALEAWVERKEAPTTLNVRWQMSDGSVRSRDVQAQ